MFLYSCLLINCLFLNSIVAYGGPYNSTYKQRTINDLTRLVSNWINKATYKKVLDAIDPTVYSLANCSEVGTQALSALVANLNGSGQYGQVMTWAGLMAIELTPVGVGVVTALSTLKDVLWNNICPFMAQLQGWLTEHEPNLTEAGATENGYRLVDQFITFQRIETIMKRAKAAYVSAGQWSTIRNSSIGTWILFSQYGI